MKVLVVLCAIIFLCESIQIPPNFKTCNRKQPNFKKCLLEAARYGVTQLNRPYKQLQMLNLEPLILPKIIATVETPLINVTANLLNCKFHGFTKTQIEDFVFDFEKKNIQLVATFPQLNSACDYEINGHILRSPIQGSGSSSMTFNNFHWKFNLAYEEVKRRGKTYVKAVSSTFDGKPETLSANLNDLFGGDKELSARLNKIINDNWSQLYDDVKIYYLENARSTLLQVFSGWFSRLSLEEAFDN